MAVFARPDRNGESWPKSNSKASKVFWLMRPGRDVHAREINMNIVSLSHPYVVKAVE